MDTAKYINRDVSWLEFNSRVLEEAHDKGNPLLERLKFLAIFSSNLDEFYMVRMAGISKQLGSGVQVVYKDYSYIPEQLLEKLDRKIRQLVKKQYDWLIEDILPALEQEGVVIADYASLDHARQVQLSKHFTDEILPVLTPVGVDQSHPFPLISNLELQLLVKLEKESREHYAIIEVPSIIPRFVVVESSPQKIVYVKAEDLISHHLDMLLAGCRILEVAEFRLTRDMDFSIDEESIADLLSELQITLQKTAKRQVIRLEISDSMSKASRNWLLENLQIPSSCLFPVRGILNLKNMFELTGIKKFPHLCDKEMPPLESVHISKDQSMFEAIARKGAFVVHHPYEAFTPLVKFLEEAADDPNVLAIKQTLYRVSGNSPVVKALVRAARNNKQVSVLVELKARFDEENNIAWAMELADAGAHVVYGIAGLKVHCKALLVVRKEDDGIHRYVHLSTGNYNDKTARLYTDIGFFSNDKLLAADVSALFNVITGFSNPPVWNKLIVAPFNLRERLIFMINREAKLSTAENPGHIVMKINSLIDYELIDCLYEAAKQNVKIDLLVRGICGLNPYCLGKFAGNIRVVSVLDRFLEHSRIYYFRNNDSPEYYLGSADVMPRNLRRRIELLFPVDNDEIRKELDFIINAAFGDKRKGRELVSANLYSKISANGKYEKLRSQYMLYDYYRKRREAANIARTDKQHQDLIILRPPPKENRVE